MNLIILPKDLRSAAGSEPEAEREDVLVPRNIWILLEEVANFVVSDRERAKALLAEAKRRLDAREVSRNEINGVRLRIATLTGRMENPLKL